MAEILPSLYSCFPLAGLEAVKNVNFGVSPTIPSADLHIYVVEGSKTPKDSSTQGVADIKPQIAVDGREELIQLMEAEVQRTEFKGGVGTSVRVSQLGVGQLATVGAGEMEGKGGKKELTVCDVDKIGKAIAELIKQIKVPQVAVALGTGNVSSCFALSHHLVLVQSIMEGLCVDDRFKSNAKKEKPLKLTSLQFCGPSFNAATISEARAVTAGVLLTKELIVTPANYCHPASLVAFVKSRCASEWKMKCKIIEEAEALELKMNSYLAVGRGAFIPPRFIHITYEPASGPAKKVIAFVGKGVCHDTGGYNLKVNSNIELMKYDMGGAAATFGLAEIISQIRPEGVEVHFVVPAVENRIDSKSYLPGDIVTASNGKTIEVINTDAEGRLILNDALVYATRVLSEKSETVKKMVVDTATLTGAIMIGIGTSLAGFYSTCDEMVETFKKLAPNSVDRFWHMPLENDYKETIDGNVSDLKNIGTRYGGSIVAALFLQQFVETDKVSWSHFDIAGCAWDYVKNVPTGWGPRLYWEYIKTVSKE